MCKFVTICCPITLKIFETNTVTGELFTGQWIFKGATIRLPGGGGGPGFFSLVKIFFSVTFWAKIFFFNLS